MKKTLARMAVLALLTGMLTACSKPEPVKEAAVTTEAAAEVTEAAEEITEAADPYEGLTLYESETGISIYMEEGYTESSAEGMPCFFEGEMSNVSFTEETFETLQTALEQGGYGSVLTSEDYGKLIYEVYQIEGSELLENEYGDQYMTYEKDFQGMGVTYYVYFEKGEDSWWTINFMCPTEVKDEMETDFHLWATSIVVP